MSRNYQLPYNRVCVTIHFECLETINKCLETINKCLETHSCPPSAPLTIECACQYPLLSNIHFAYSLTIQLACNTVCLQQSSLPHSTPPLPTVHTNSFFRAGASRWGYTLCTRREVGGWGRHPKKCTGRDWGMGSSTI